MHKVILGIRFWKQGKHQIILKSSTEKCFFLFVTETGEDTVYYDL